MSDDLTITIKVDPSAVSTLRSVNTAVRSLIKNANQLTAATSATRAFTQSFAGAVTPLRGVSLGVDTTTASVRRLQNQVGRMSLFEGLVGAGGRSPGGIFLPLTAGAGQFEKQIQQTTNATNKLNRSFIPMSRFVNDVGRKGVFSSGAGELDKIRLTNLAKGFGNVGLQAKAATSQISSLRAVVKTSSALPSALSAFGLGAGIIPGGGAVGGLAAQLGFAGFLGRIEGISIGTIAKITGIGVGIGALTVAAKEAVQQELFLEERLVRTALAAGRSGKEIGDLREGVVKLSKDTKLFTLTEVTGAVEALVKAGESLEEVFGKQGAVALKFSLLAETTTDQATQFLINTANQLETTVDVVADAIVRIADISTTDIVGASQFIQRSALTATSLGLSLSELGAVGAILANFGIKSETASRSLNRLAVSFERIKVGELTSAQERTFERLGLDKMVAQIQAGEASLFDLLSALRKTGAGIGDLSSLFDIFGARAASALIKGLPDLDEFIKQMDAAKGATERGAKALEETGAGSMRMLSAQFSRFINNISGPFIAAWDLIMITIQGSLGIINAVIESFGALANAIRTVLMLSNLGEVAEPVLNFQERLSGLPPEGVLEGINTIKLPREFLDSFLGGGPIGGLSPVFEQIGEAAAATGGNLEEILNKFLARLEKLLLAGLVGEERAQAQTELGLVFGQLRPAAIEAFNSALPELIKQAEAFEENLSNRAQSLDPASIFKKGENPFILAARRFVEIVTEGAKSVVDKLAGEQDHFGGAAGFIQSGLDGLIQVGAQAVAETSTGFLKDIGGQIGGVVGGALGGPVGAIIGNLLGNIFVDAANAMVAEFADGIDKIMAFFGYRGEAQKAIDASRRNKAALTAPIHQGAGISTVGSAGGFSLTVGSINVGGGFKDSNEVGRAITRELDSWLRRKQSDITRTLSTRREGREIV